MNSLTLLQGSQMPALCLLSGALGGIIGSFLGVVVERIPRSSKRRREPEICCFRPLTVLRAPTRSPGGKISLF